MRLKQFGYVLVLAMCGFTGIAAAQSASAVDPLPSWHEGPTKSAIVDFVQAVSTEGSPNFVPVAERIATLDNDGTLWSEQPMYFQGFFALDRLRSMAADHPEWKTTEPYKSALAGDAAGVMATGMEGIEKLLGVTHGNVTADDFAAAVSTWLTSAKHPKTGRLYTQMVFQPMLELLDYLRANDFKTYIVSGGGIDFMRVFSEATYGIPPEQVIGTTFDAKFEMRNGIPTIVKEPELNLLNDNSEKPVGIYQHIGRRPIFAAGNSDGDMQMLEYTTIARNSADTTPRFGLLVHHTDADREYAYDRTSRIGQLDKALDAAKARGWVVVDMKEDWEEIYPVKK